MLQRVLSCILLTLLGGCCGLSCRCENSPHNSAGAEANVKLAIAFLQQGFLKEAKEKLILARQLDPGDPAVWYGRGFFNETIGEINDANNDYQKAIQLAPQNGSAHNNYGAFLCRAGQYKASLHEFALAVKDTEYLDSGSTYENAGLCALKIPDAKLAKYYFQKALEQEPSLKVSARYLQQLQK